MRTKLRRMSWLWLCLGALVALSSFACRRSTPTLQRTPNQLESELDTLVVEADLSKRARVELAEDEVLAPPAPEPAPVPTTPPRARTVAKTDARLPATSAPTTQTERVSESPPTEMPPTPPPPTPPPPAPKAKVTQPQEPAQQPWWPRPEEPERKKHDTAFSIAVAIGALGVGMGSASAMTGDGRPGETSFTVVSLGIGAAGFATALVLYATEPPPQKGVRVTVSPVGVNGSF